MAFISFSHYGKHTPTALGLVQHLLMLSQLVLWRDTMHFHRLQTQYIAAYFFIIKSSCDTLHLNSESLIM